MKRGLEHPTSSRSQHGAQPDNPMGTLVFAVAGYNLAETGRMIEIARAARDHLDVLFLRYGGRFEELIGGEGLGLGFAIRLNE